MGIEYVISGGQLYFDKKVFTKEILLPYSPLRNILASKDNSDENKQPVITKTDHSVIIDYNDASDIKLNENYEELFENLKLKYKEKIKGKITIRINLYNSYFMVVDLDNDEKVIYK